MLLDGEAISVTAVDSVIDSDMVIIGGGFDEVTAYGLALLINRGELPFGFKVVEE